MQNKYNSVTLGAGIGVAALVIIIAVIIAALIVFKRRREKEKYVLRLKVKGRKLPCLHFQVILDFYQT